MSFDKSRKEKGKVVVVIKFFDFDLRRFQWLVQLFEGYVFEAIKTKVYSYLPGNFVAFSIMANRDGEISTIVKFAEG